MQEGRHENLGSYKYAIANVGLQKGHGGGACRRQLDNWQSVILAARSYRRDADTGNQLYSQPRHRQPVILAAHAQATSYELNPGTGNQL